MFTNIQFVLIWITPLICTCTELQKQYIVPQYPDEYEWDRDVYTARHFDDLVLPATAVDDVTSCAAVLILYTPDCDEDRRGGDDLHYSSLPPQKYLVYAKHDWETVPMHVPYTLTGKESLLERYQPHTCPSVYYLDKGKSVHNPQVWNPEEQAFQNFIWSKFHITFKLKNFLESTVAIRFIGPGPEFETLFLHTGETIDVDCYVSYLLTANLYQGEDLHPKFLFGRVLEYSDNSTVFEFVPDMKMPDYNTEAEWLLATQAAILAEEDKIRHYQFTLAEIYLMNFKQATLLPKFTTEGLDKRPMPGGLQESLFMYYQHNIEQREPEGFELDPLVNDKEIKCGIVPVFDDIKEMVFSVIQPIAEDWCKQKLRPTALYGIREYYRGNILRQHVDRPATHVISVIMPVYVDLEGNSDWLMLAINHLGNHVNMTLSPGEMLIYESASVIYGRPSPFQGRVYATMYVHFQPEFDWLWSEQKLGQPERRYLVNGQNFEFVEPMFILATDVTKKRFIKFEDEL